MTGVGQEKKDSAAGKGSQRCCGPCQKTTVHSGNREKFRLTGCHVGGGRQEAAGSGKAAVPPKLLLLSFLRGSC